MQRVLPVILLAVLLPVHVYTLPVVTAKMKGLPAGDGDSYIMPSSVLKISALEFEGLMSDFLFLKALVLRGGISEGKEGGPGMEREWRWLYDILKASTDLDPYFLDPYYFGNAHLTWDAGLIRETNDLLEKGSRYREWDWMLPFFIGFNHFYFLQENARASEYLMEASRKPGASPFLAKLAARLAYEGRKTENAIIFLKAILRETEDEAIRKEYEKRLRALEGILFLERAVTVYRERFGKEPVKIKELVEKGIIRRVPEDPYGGEFYIDTDGFIKTTSNMVERRG